MVWGGSIPPGREYWAGEGLGLGVEEILFGRMGLGVFGCVTRGRIGVAITWGGFRGWRLGVMFGLGVGWEIVLDDEELRKETPGRELNPSFTFGNCRVCRR